MSKAKFSAQAEKLKNLVDSARLQTSSSARLQTSSSAVTATAPSQPNEGAEEVSGRPVAARTKAKNLKAIPLSYFEAHAELKATSKTSLDFSSYIIEAIREKLERDGAIGQ
ncbi:TPA: molecular chaperone GroEL [Escherichia coli]|uniref:molecular chaperone GroEL n=3 Tax=Enterobacteriaceae TaxID=543 RepID=UPI000BE5553B|nr:molecular chaperone GroEL [Escherichia coli]EBR9324159.1 molecular chaperone GroEL [Salmonella enterica subsp. enterica serovar Ajiobo]HCB9700306.1 molecular chaperone GroEL [Escherichia coli]HEA6327127.1 molecular chaperone GroEL [Escherichia coli]